MFRYPARLKADEAGFTVTFRDIPEAITAGAIHEEAIESALQKFVRPRLAWRCS